MNDDEIDSVVGIMDEVEAAYEVEAADNVEDDRVMPGTGQTYFWSYITLDGVHFDCERGIPCGPMSRANVIKRIAHWGRKIEPGDGVRDGYGYRPFLAIAMDVFSLDIVADVLGNTGGITDDDVVETHWTDGATGDMIISHDFTFEEIVRAAYGEVGQV